MSRPVDGFDPEILRGDRLDAGLTQRGLGRLSGLDGSTISLWESGKRRPDRVAYAQVLQVLMAAEDNSPPDWLWRNGRDE